MNKSLKPKTPKHKLKYIKQWKDQNKRKHKNYQKAYRIKNRQKIRDKQNAKNKALRLQKIDTKQEILSIKKMLKKLVETPKQKN